MAGWCGLCNKILLCGCDNKESENNSAAMECKHGWDEEMNGTCALCVIERQQEQNSHLSDGLNALIREAEEQRKWFDKESRKEKQHEQAIAYAEGSRDAYAYMINAIKEIKESI